MRSKGHPSRPFALELRRELDAWAESGRQATLWWRDDDAKVPGPGLDRLLTLARSQGVPLTLAVIPAGMSADLATGLVSVPGITVIQHGFAHVSHAPRGRNLGLWELGRHRPVAVVLDEMRRGKALLESAFGDRFLPVMAPPWNRVDAGLYPGLAVSGYTGITISGVRPSALPVPGLTMANIHTDVTKWSTPRGQFRGGDEICADLAGHLHRRRTGEIDTDEPTGLTTHHWALCEESWLFLAGLLDLVKAHPAATWLGATDLFPRTRPDPDRIAP